MNKHLFPRPRLPGRVARPLGALAVLVAWGVLGAAAARAADWEILFSRTPAGPGSTFKLIGLRGNVDNRLYLSVKNETAAAENVALRLSALGADGKWQPLVEKPVVVPANTTVPVSFAPPPEPAPKAGEGKPKDAKPLPPPPLTPVTGPPFKLLFQVVAKDKAGKDRVLAEDEVFFQILHPSQVVNVPPPAFELIKGEGNALSVTATALKDFSGPPAQVDLVLLPGEDLIPGLIVTKKEGIYTQKLTKANATTKLVARNLQFEGGVGPPSGLVYVTVDGFPRAYRYPTPFSRSGTAELAVTSPAVRIAAMPVFGKPAEKVVVPLEVDAPGNLEKVNVLVELLVPVGDGNDGPVFEQRDARTLVGARRLNIGVATVDPTGALLFKAEVQDWQVEMDTAGLFGEVRVRARLLDEKGKKLPAVADAELTLMFDDTPPIVKFAAPKDFPRQLVRGAPLPLKATGGDPETGISKVVFFAGKPVLNKDAVLEPPANAELIPGQLSPGPEPKTLSATALLPLPNAQKGMTLDVSVQFVNGAKQSSFDTIKIELVEPGAAGDPAAGKKFKVEGRVLQGTIPQPNLDVQLRDDKGAVKATTKTASGQEKGKAAGTFVFVNIPPGVYTATASNSASKSRGQASATVDTSDVKNVEIKLLR